MMRRSNFTDFEDLFERMNRQFEEMSRQFEGSFEGGGLSMHGVSLDVTDHDDRFVVTADVPGFEKSDIDVTIADRTLTISATRETEAEHEESQYLRRERGQASVRRTVRLPEMVLEDEASATYKNGVLTVTLPKMEAESDDESRHIEIE